MALRPDQLLYVVIIMPEYIEKEAVLKALDERAKHLVGDKTVSVDAFRTFIENRPAADVRPVAHGMWIKDRRYAVCSERFICSECWYPENFRDRRKTPFCPNCGAKMDGKDMNVPATAEDESYA